MDHKCLGWSKKVWENEISASLEVTRCAVRDMCDERTVSWGYLVLWVSGVWLRGPGPRCQLYIESVGGETSSQSPAWHLVTTGRVTAQHTDTPGEKSRRKSVPRQDNTSTCVEFSSVIILTMNVWWQLLGETFHQTPILLLMISAAWGHPEFTFWCKVLNRDESADFIPPGGYKN